MRYEILLKAIQPLDNSEDGFDSSMVSGFLREVNEIQEEKWDPNILAKKRISNDLNRLYRMQFLNRKRVRRQVKTRTGRICNRGYNYVYKISKQGKSYAKYLEEPKPLRLLNESQRRKSYFYLDYRVNPYLQMIRKNLPNNPEYVQRIIDGLIKPVQFAPMLKARGRYNRFPQRIDLELLLMHLISQENNKISKSQIEYALGKVEQIEIIRNKEIHLFLTLKEILEDPLKLLKLVRAQLAELGINPVITSDFTFAGVSQGIAPRARTSLLYALDWIIREAEKQRPLSGQRKGK